MSASSLVLSSLLSLPSTVHLPATVQSEQHPIDTDETGTQEHSNANLCNHYYHYYHYYYCYYYNCLLQTFFWDTLQLRLKMGILLRNNVNIVTFQFPYARSFLKRNLARVVPSQICFLSEKEQTQTFVISAAASFGQNAQVHQSAVQRRCLFSQTTQLLVKCWR